MCHLRFRSLCRPCSYVIWYVNRVWSWGELVISWQWTTAYACDMKSVPWPRRDKAINSHYTAVTSVDS